MWVWLSIVGGLLLVAGAVTHMRVSRRGRRKRALPAPQRMLAPAAAALGLVLLVAAAALYEPPAEDQEAEEGGCSVLA